MSRNAKQPSKLYQNLIEVKSKFDAEFRRFSADKAKVNKYEEFCTLVETLHRLQKIPFVITYTDPVHGDLLPINNDDNLRKALSMAQPLLRLMVQRRDECDFQYFGYGTLPIKKRNPISKLMNNDPLPKPRLQISMPEDFRRVSAIIDVDIVPETHRRVKLMKNGSDKPLGFYIRDGTSVRVTSHGLEKVPAIFISRLVPGGLAESTGLLAVNDEVLEVNGIEVSGKTLDQVTDMMVANSSNLIITVKPVNQRLTLAPQLGKVGRHSQNSQISQNSTGSLHSHKSSKSMESDTVVEHSREEEEEDEVHEHIKLPTKTPSNHSNNAPKSSNVNNKDTSKSSNANNKDTSSVNNTHATKSSNGSNKDAPPLLSL